MASIAVISLLIWKKADLFSGHYKYGLPSKEGYLQNYIHSLIDRELQESDGNQKHNNYSSFATDTQKSKISQLSLIGKELPLSGRNRKHKHNNNDTTA